MNKSTAARLSNPADLGGSFALPGTSLNLRRLGYGAMQLAGPHVFGPPKDRAGAIAVLREVVELGITHIDTSDFYGRISPINSSKRRCIPIRSSSRS